MIEIDLEKVCFIVVKAREFHAKVEVVEPDPGSNPSDEDFREILEDYADDSTHSELKQFIANLNEDEIADLLALMWLGRGDFGKDEWPAMLTEARRIETRSAPDYLIGTPQVADYLEEGLSELGYSCQDFEQGRL